MNIEVKNSVKPVDYLQSIKILENRVDDVLLGKKDELLWILEHKTVYTGGTSSNTKDLINKNLKIIKTKRGGKYTIHTPLIKLTKEEIIKKGISLNVDFSLTVSCYQADNFGRACGLCDSCVFRKNGFKNAGVIDPTTYQKLISN